MASLRAALPRAGFSLHSKQLQQRWLLPSLRHASTTPPPPPKPRVLEKPDKFRPPSHPARLKTKSRYTYGPDLTQQQKTRRYPHMMPPEGSFLHWFLTNRTIHLCLTLGILVSLAFAAWLSDFIHTTPFLDILPPNSMVFAHPIQFLRQYMEVYWMHLEYNSAQANAKRKRKLEDVHKRSEYRKAHGLEQAEAEKFGGWTARSKSEVSGSARSVQSQADDMSPKAAVVPENVEQGQETFVDFEGKEQPVRKKWFGIW